MTKEKPAYNNDYSKLEDLLNTIDGKIKDLHINDSILDSESRLSREEFTKNISITNHFHVLLNELETKAYLQYNPEKSSPPENLKANDIFNRIKQEGIVSGLINKNIQKAFSIIRESPNTFLEVVIAIGQEPKPGQPPKIVYWIGDDYEEEQAVNEYYVRKNDLILKLDKGKPGIPGINVRGVEIQPADEESLKIYANENILCNTQGEYYASCPGMVSLRDGVLTLRKIDRDASFSLHLSEDHMQAFLSIDPPSGQGKKVEFDEVRSHMLKLGIKKGVDFSVVQYAIEMANQKEQPAKDIVIAQGRGPTTGTNGEIKWHIKPVLSSERYTIREDGSVDFYNLRDFVTVMKDTHLVTVIPPTQGREGFTVTGEKIPGLWGEKNEIVAGDNITKKDNDQKWYAGCTGKYYSHDNILDVLPVLLIQKDVDFSTGNIDFMGDIIINGNILDGFTVKTTGSVTVGGTIEAANVSAGRDIEVKKGIFGKGKGKVVAGNDVISAFLQNARVEAGHDVVIGNQILNSVVSAAGCVVLQAGKGSITGGKTTAGYKISARIIGNEYGTKTFVEVGINNVVLERMMLISEKKQTLTGHLERLDHFLKAQKQSKEDMDDEQEQLVSTAQKKRKQLLTAIDHLSDEYQELALKLYTTKHPVITCSHMIMSDVIVKLRERRYKFHQPVPNCIITYDNKKDKIHIQTK